MLLAYPGPEDGVFLPASGLQCPRGVPVDIPDEDAESLLEQGWTKPQRGKPKTAPKKRGGRVAKQPPQLVGEHGPENVVLPAGTEVTPHKPTPEES